ncbi:unnamed protein product [Amoebophrya sp. A120]|nr:unnamed protein product [Amoebophrya sp. A120]|eukprot:GSA120T00010788001.1
MPSTSKASSSTAMKSMKKTASEAMKKSSEAATTSMKKAMKAAPVTAMKKMSEPVAKKAASAMKKAMKSAMKVAPMKAAPAAAPASEEEEPVVEEQTTAVARKSYFAFLGNGVALYSISLLVVLLSLIAYFYVFLYGFPETTALTGFFANLDKHLNDFSVYVSKFVEDLLGSGSAAPVKKTMMAQAPAAGTAPSTVNVNAAVKGAAKMAEKGMKGMTKGGI